MSPLWMCFSVCVCVCVCFWGGHHLTSLSLHNITTHLDNCWDLATNKHTHNTINTDKAYASYCKPLLLLCVLICLKAWHYRFFSGPQPRWTTPVTLTAPTYPATFLPGGFGPQPVVRVMQPSYYHPMPPHAATYAYADPFTDPHAWHQATPVTYATVQPTIGHPPHVAVTYAHQYPISSYGQYTYPMPDVQWSHTSARPVPVSSGQHMAALKITDKLTGKENQQLMSAQPTARSRPINSLPELPDAPKSAIVTQSQRYLITRIL